MERLILKQSVITTIRKDAMLYGKIASALNVSPMSIPRILAANSLRLTEASVLKALRDHLGVTEDSNLLEAEG